MFELLFTHPLWAYRTGTFAFASGWPLWLLFACILAGAALIAASLLRRRQIGAIRLGLIGVTQTALLALILCLVWRPVLNVERVRDRENVLAVALDASASMAHADSHADSSGAADRSRLQLATTAVRDTALPALQKSFEVRLFSFAARTESLPSIDAVPPPGAQTRIGDALLQLLQTAGSVPLAGIVLISDGAENGDTLSEEHLAEIASFGVPVHTVGVGPEQIPGDLQLEDVRVAQLAAAGSTVTAGIEVRHDGAATTRLRVYDNDRLLAARELKLPADANLSSYSIEFPVGEAGTHDLRFSLDAVAGERNLINNRRAHVLNVPAGRRRILYIEGEPRWEYKFVRRALESERSLRLTSIVRTTPNKYFRQGVSHPAELIQGFPTEAAELFAYDAVIIGSYEASSLSTQQHQLLRDFVDKRGGSVLLLAGRHGLSAGGWGSVAVAQTLPTHLPEKQAGSFVQRQGGARPSLYGVESAIARFDTEPKRNSELWKGLPALADFQTLGRLKPGAIVLLEIAAERAPMPLLVWQRYGRGAAYVLGTASTLRWQMQSDPVDQRHELFWRQLGHALADTASPRAMLTSDRSVYDDERRVSLEAELHDARFEPISDARVELLVAPEHDAHYTVQMQASGDNDGRYVANIDAPSTGLYRIDMTAHSASAAAAPASAYVRRNDGVLEHFDARQNRAVLERIASMTGGRYWQLADLDQLAAAIPYSKAGIVERQTLDLWNLPIVFVTLLALKLGEWLLRLKWGKAVRRKEVTGYRPQGTARVRATSSPTCCLLPVACSLSLLSPLSSADTYSFILSGLGGERTYEQRFLEQTQTLSAAAQQLTGDASKVITLAGDEADRDSIRRELRALAARMQADDQIIVTLIGHGSFDGDEYRFNLPGPDLTATELAALFDQLPARQQLIVNASSASGAAVERWKRDNRIVITATKSGGERTATRFSQYWVKALSSVDADVNKDDIVTAGEAFEFASRKVAESFKSDASLATEHARLDGDSAGSFQVARFGTAARVTTNPQLNELFAQRVRIERDLDAVRERQATLAADAYYDELEGVLVKLALLQKDIDAKQQALGE